MFGQLKAVGFLDVDGRIREHQLSFGHGGKLQRERARAVSAVALLQSYNPRYRGAIHEPFVLLKASDGLTDPVEQSQALCQLINTAIGNGLYDPDESRQRLIVLHNPFALIPAPMGAFTGAADVQFGLRPSPGGDTYAEIHAGPDAHLADTERPLA